jgi:hypothetical protein
MMLPAGRQIGPMSIGGPAGSFSLSAMGTPMGGAGQPPGAAQPSRMGHWPGEDYGMPMGQEDQRMLPPSPVTTQVAPPSPAANPQALAQGLIPQPQIPPGHPANGGNTPLAFRPHLPFGFGWGQDRTPTGPSSFGFGG